MSEGSNFAGIVNAPKQEHEAAIHQESERQAKELEDRARMVSAGVEWLKQVVMPLADEARTALLPEAIRLEVTTEFDVMNYVSRPPEITFQCIGLPRRNQFGGTSQAKSFLYRVKCDGATFSIGCSQYGGHPNNWGNPIAIGVSSASEKIKIAISESIKQYDESLRDEPK